MTEFLAPVEVKLLAGDTRGAFAGYASAFGGAPDAYGDTIAPGAFSTSLAEHAAAGTRPLMLWSHDPARPIGVWTSIREDQTGLHVEGMLTTDSRDGADAYALLRSAAINGLSIGFRTRDSERLPGGGRLLKAIDLVEVSIVAMPAAPRARVTDIKSAGADAVAAGPAAHTEDRNMDEENGAPADEAGAERRRFDAIDSALTKLNDRLDRIELKANRPGAAAVENKADQGTKAFTGFLRRGAERMDPIEVKDLTVNSDTGGGYLAPEAFIAELLKNIVQFSPIRGVARVMPMSSASVVLPRRTSTLTASWVSETGPRPETQPVYGQVRYVPNEGACYVDISNQLLEDAAIDIASELSMDFAEEFGRLEGAAFVNGTGGQQPAGFMLDSNIQSTPSGSATAVTADGLIDLFHAVSSAYRGNGTWLMNATTMAAVRKLKTTDGHYLLALSGIANAPTTTIFGRPVVEAVDMPDVAGGSFPIIFGDFRQGYRIFDRVQLALLRDPYSQATSGLTRFHARRRVAGGVGKAEALRKLRIATS